MNEPNKQKCKKFITLDCHVYNEMTNPEHIQPVIIKAGIITVSSSRTKETDTSGKIIQELLQAAGISIIHYSIVADQIDVIRQEVVCALQSCNCIVVNGGTGLTHDDCTVEAVTDLLEKQIDGFGEFFRHKSLAEIGTAAMLSRAIAGVTNGRAVFCIPGSNPAVRLATKELILPEIRHIISHAQR